MKIFICGIDGYLGWAFACRMKQIGHDIYGCDNETRRCAVREVESDSALEIHELVDRENILDIVIHKIDVMHELDYAYLAGVLKEIKPDVILHLAEIPSAPYSMISRQFSLQVQYNNIIGTLNILYAMRESCPEAHLIKLGTMGEYGIPDIDITEGDIHIEHNGRSDKLPFPCKPLSFYHASKVADSVNIRLACKLWGIRCTDIMQGIVYGTSIPETKNNPTRFDFDEYFGTVINRFCAQAVINHPLTVYGGGNHKRALLPLADSMQCLEIICHNPPEAGEYRVINQFEQYLSMNELAMIVQKQAETKGLMTEIVHIENPRVEEDNHHYNPERKKLIDMGYQPTMQIDSVVSSMLDDLLPYKDRILKHRDVIMPKTRWVA